SESEPEPREIDGGAHGDGSPGVVVGNGTFGVTVEGADGVRRAAQAGADAPGGGPSGGGASAGRGDPIQPPPSPHRRVVGSAGSLSHPGWISLTGTPPRRYGGCGLVDLHDGRLGELVVEALLVGLIPQ